MTDTVPTVSVVIPAYRAEAFIARAIQSVLDQPGVEPQIIVVVDGVVDRTAEVAKGFPKTHVVINEVNRGAPAARNRGLTLVRAPYVMFLDADDWVEGPLLQGLVEALDNFDAYIAFGPRERKYESGRPSIITSVHTGADEKPHEISTRDLMVTFLKGASIHPCSTMWKTGFFRKHGGWDESLVRFQDFEIVYRCLIREERAALSTKGCGVFYDHNSKHRITHQMSQSVLQSQLAATVSIFKEAKSKGIIDDLLKQAFIIHTEEMMRSFARSADDNIYRDAKSFFDSLGGQKTPGTLAHRVGCFLLGLRRKEKLAFKVANIKRVLYIRRSML